MANPIIRGVKVLCSTFLKKLKTPEGRVTLFFLKTPTKFKPSSSMTSEATMPSIAENVKLIPIALPISPKTPPKRAKLTNLLV